MGTIGFSLAPMLKRLLIAAMLMTGAPASAQTAEGPAVGRTAWLFSTVGHSEWCPAGNVTVDLRTGRYSLTKRAARRVCGQPMLERPVTKGTLDGRRLTSVRAAYMRVLTDGLESEVCREGRRPDTIVISNGGTPTLLLVTGAFTATAPDNLACWSDAANTLHDVLDHIFAAEDYRPAR